VISAAAVGRIEFHIHLSYRPACELQRRLVAARKAAVIPRLLPARHPHVITLVAMGSRQICALRNPCVAQMNVEFYSTDRGGDITYHGPGTDCWLPHPRSGAHRRDVRWYVSQLEEAMMLATTDFGVATKRAEGQHGVWVDTPPAKKNLRARRCT